jgi:hypothetical protein
LQALLRFSASVLIGSITAGRLLCALAESARQEALAESIEQDTGTTSRVGDCGAGPSKGKKEGLQGRLGRGVPLRLEGLDCALSSLSARRFI